LPNTSKRRCMVGSVRRSKEEHHVDIRTARVDDAAAIATVHVESWRTTYKGIVPDDFLARLSYEQRGQFWRQVLTEPGSASFVYVADDGPGQVVGFVSGGPERSGDTLYTGELYAIYLFASYQGQGIGRQLVSTLVTRLMQEGMTALLLWVLAANPARQFYERLGGQHVYEKTVTIGGVPLLEIAYGWRDARTIITPSQWEYPGHRGLG
jgi:ribosomal protein S18 acetylase RimI-like enzyme